MLYELNIRRNYINHASRALYIGSDRIRPVKVKHSRYQHLKKHLITVVRLTMRISVQYLYN